MIFKLIVLKWTYYSIIKTGYAENMVKRKTHFREHTETNSMRARLQTVVKALSFTTCFNFQNFASSFHKRYIYSICF